MENFHVGGCTINEQKNNSEYREDLVVIREIAVFVLSADTSHFSVETFLNNR